MIFFSTLQVDVFLIDTEFLFDEDQTFDIAPSQVCKHD
jgi:hypothetical protein